jgi:putative transposase
VPQRKTIFATNQYYHVFNRSINKEPIFTRQKECNRAITTINYYRFEKPPIRLSYLLALGVERRNNILKSLEDESRTLVDIVCYVLMPNHFHFLLKQNSQNGISLFLAQFQNSFTRYFNTKNNRQGHLIQGQFKAVLIEDDNQLLHVNRYIHLNPYVSYVVKNLTELEKYPYSSLPEYMVTMKNEICNKNSILSHFKTSKRYKKFVFDQAEYQRSLHTIQHLTLE